MKSPKSIITFTAGAILILILVMALPVSSAMADSIGPNNPAVGTNENGIGTVAWQNPGNITIPDSSSASAVLTGRVTSNYLQGTNFGFVIPDGATISGIELTINRRVSDHNAGFYDNVVKLVQDGVISGENRAITTTVWTTGFTLVTYGGPTDLWGIDWSTTDINKSNFGAVISVSRTNNGSNYREALVDSMQIKVYYVLPANMSVSCGDGTPITYGESVLCTATVTNPSGSETPNGMVNWSSDGIGEYSLNPCILSGQNGTASCTTTYTPHAMGTGTHLLTAAYDGGTSFTPSQKSQSVNVAQRPLTVTADAQTKVYGSQDPEYTFSYTPELVFNDAFTGTLTRDPGEDVGQYPISQGTLMVNENYALTYEGNYLEITQAEAICTITPYEVTYDGTPHTATGSCLGVKNEQLAGLDLSGTTHTDVGSYTDTWNFTDVTGNYNDLSSTVVNEITRRAITVTADAQSKVIGQTDPELTYQVSAGTLLEGDAFSGSLARQPGEKPGTYAIQQGTLALPDYYEITYVSAEFTIVGHVIYVPFMRKW